MTTLTFVDPQGGLVTIESGDQPTVMHAATAAGLQGIVGECGGAAMCATCHVYVDPGDLAGLPPVSSYEDEMLDCTASPRRENSRLGCQIKPAHTLQHLRLELPERQV